MTNWDEKKPGKAVAERRGFKPRFPINYASTTQLMEIRIDMNRVQNCGAGLSL
ncbi:hypothetical protein [Planktothrix sp. PCC 11201]|uniref:hypothetical protein n=1 Tax=Planktothrix sp. PCC 11201 TaxID=1729650 RepID=UPI0013564442|nr:hypothetical protein [Planktothrix sp. PCC 11201]